MPEVFASYKREDEARVRPLVEALKGAGIDAWWDQDMLPGARIQAVIHEILDKVACVVVQDTRELARTAVDRLLQLQNGDEGKNVLWVEPYLHPRITTL